MCGRFTLSADKKSLENAFPGAAILADIAPRYNIAPSQPVAVIRDIHTKAVEFLRWGLIPHWAKDEQIGHKMINARAETLAEKPSFREPFKRRRCLILADGFYEWHKDPHGRHTVPMYIRLKSGRPFAFAGLWDSWRSGDEELRTCTIITTTSNELVASIHDRMPVILAPENYWEWISADVKDLKSHEGLLVPYPSDEMEAFRVSARVNDPKVEGPECVEREG